ncbi:MAG: hypothetical protein ACLFV4_06215 [Candidatus Hydrogenedentota bacterium]
MMLQLMRGLMCLCAAVLAGSAFAQAQPGMSPQPRSQEEVDEFLMEGDEVRRGRLREDDMPRNPELYYRRVEEPALRPFKAFFRGIGAVFYQSVKALKEGNEKFPGLGTVEVFRGLRKGGVELVHGTYMGMAGTEHWGYDELGDANNMINDNLLLAHMMDTATAWGLFTAYDVHTRTATQTTGLIFAGQMVTDTGHFHPEAVEMREFRREQEEQEQARGAAARERYLERPRSARRN